MSPPAPTDDNYRYREHRSQYRRDENAMPPPRSRSATPSSRYVSHNAVSHNAERPDPQDSYVSGQLGTRGISRAQTSYAGGASEYVLPPAAGPPPRSRLPDAPGRNASHNVAPADYGPPVYPPPMKRPPPNPQSTLLRTVDKLLFDLEDCMEDLENEDAEEDDRRPPLPPASVMRSAPPRGDDHHLSYREPRQNWDASDNYSVSTNAMGPPRVASGSTNMTDHSNSYVRNPRSLDLARPFSTDQHSEAAEYAAANLRPPRSSARTSLLSDAPLNARHSYHPSDILSTSSRSSIISNDNDLSRRRQSSNMSSFNPAPKSESAVGAGAGAFGGSGGGGGGGGLFGGSDNSVFASVKTLDYLSGLPGAKCGYMSKHTTGRFFGTAWKARYYCLVNRKLWVFKTGDPSQSPDSFLPISGSTKVWVSETGVGILEVAVEETVGDGIMIPKTKVERTWSLQCESQPLMMEWLSAFRRVIAEAVVEEERSQSVRQQQRDQAAVVGRSQSTRSNNTLDDQQSNNWNRGSQNSQSTTGTGRGGPLSPHRSSNASNGNNGNGYVKSPAPYGSFTDATDYFSMRSGSSTPPPGMTKAEKKAADLKAAEVKAVEKAEKKAIEKAEAAVKAEEKKKQKALELKRVNKELMMMTLAPGLV
ncbi:hypothetical protein HKX48_006639 [Thoreauomyces humboldtii]|nr:hypothetical protein HKX48_006639 [Thoreauomyces humboldtii]